MVRNLIVFVLVLFSAAKLRAEPPPVELFAALPQADDPHLSPDGEAVAMIANEDGRAAVRVWHPSGREQWFFPASNNQLNWIAWKGNDRLVLSLRFTSVQGGRPVGATRLMFTELASSQSVQVVFREPVPPPDSIIIARQAFQPPNLQDRVVSLLPKDPQNILLAAAIGDDASRPQVMEVDVRSGRPRPALKPMGAIVRWIADADGVVRLRQNLEFTDGSPHGLVVRVRDGADGEWRIVHKSVADRDPRFIPVAFSKTNSSLLYVMADQDNGRLALYPFDTVSLSLGPALAADSQCDIEPVLRDNQLVGYSNPCSGSAETYLDTGWQRDQAAIRHALKTEQVAILDRTPDGKFSLLRSSRNASTPPTYWYFNQAQKTLTRIADAYPALADQISPSRRVSINMRDGAVIPALLTLPKGREQGPIAFVVLPHGGPTAHDSEEFDWIVQFIASRGYGVLQPQFRGSSGFGASFQRAGYRQWGGRMQDDVTDASTWLIKQGLADRKRICIVGFSYGGYAALMGAAKEPGLYQCAVAMAPVTDLGRLLVDRERQEFASIDRERTVDEDGVRFGQSPVDWAGSFSVPVFLIHGRQDFVVPVGHSEAMEEKLRRSGREVTALYLDQADHGLGHAADRLACLRALEAFLKAHLGNGLPLSPS